MNNVTLELLSTTAFKIWYVHVREDSESEYSLSGCIEDALDFLQECQDKLDDRYKERPIINKVNKILLKKQGLKRSSQELGPIEYNKFGKAQALMELN